MSERHRLSPGRAGSTRVQDNQCLGSREHPGAPHRIDDALHVIDVVHPHTHQCVAIMPEVIAAAEELATHGVAAGPSA